MADFDACAPQACQCSLNPRSVEKGQIGVDIWELYGHWTELSEHGHESLRRDDFQFELLRNAWGRRRVRRHTGKHLLDICLRQVACSFASIASTVGAVGEDSRTVNISRGVPSRSRVTAAS